MPSFGTARSQSLSSYGELKISFRRVGSLQFVAQTFDVRWQRQVVLPALLEHAIEDLTQHHKPPLFLIRLG